MTRLPSFLMKSPGFVSWLRFLFSPNGLAILDEMGRDDFSIDWGSLTPDEAHALLSMARLAVELRRAVDTSPSDFSLLPLAAIRGVINIDNRLSVYAGLLEDIATGRVSGLGAVIAAGDIDFSTGRGRRFSSDELTRLLGNAA